MTNHQKETARRLLEQLRQETHDALAERCPPDHVPDRIAIPALNRLERLGLDTDATIHAALAMIDNLP